MPALNGERPFEWSAELKRPLVSISAPGSPVVMSKLQTALTSPSGDGEADESQEFWQIRFTKEIYDDYEQYFQRIQLYRRPIWTCTLTGTRGLTFEEALVSERKAREHSQRIPRVLQRQLLERIQFSTVTRIDALTDLLHSQLNECYFVGEELQWNRGDGGESVAVTVIAGPSVGSSGGASDYTVRSDGEEETHKVPKQQLSRQRNALSKQTIRQYIKESASKDSHLNAPWTVRPELAERYNISTTFPAGVLWDEKEKRWRIKRPETDGTASEPVAKRRRRSAQAVVELPKPKYPIEDSELPHYIAKQKSSHRHPEMDSSAVPHPLREFTLSPDGVRLLISVWNFLYIFAKPLDLFPFSLDEFEASLRHSNIKQNNPILDQTHWRLLQSASLHTNSLLAKIKPIKARSQRRLDSLQAEEDSAESGTEDEDGKTTPAGAIVDAAANISSDQLGGDVAFGALTGGEIDATFPDRWWTWRISPREWEKALCAYLLHRATVTTVPHLQSILSKLTGLDAQVDQRDGRVDFAYGSRYWNDGSVDFRECYLKLTVEEKLECLWTLINESVVPSQRCRKFIDQSSQALAEARKEKRELDVKMRESLEALGILNKPAESAEDKKDKQSKSASESAEAVGDDDDDQEAVTAAAAGVEEDEQSGSEDGESEEDDSDEDGDDNDEFSREIREIRKKLDQFNDDDTSRQARQEKIRLQQQLRDLDDARRMERVRQAREAAKRKNAENRAKIEEKKRLDADIGKLNKRDIVLDREIRQNMAAVNLKPLGRDRFWNMYFWLDGYGSGMPAVQDYHGNQGNVRNLLPYSTGRILVCGSGRPAYLGHVSGASARQISGKKKVVDMKALERQETDGWIADPFVTLPLGFNGKRPGEALGDNWLAEDEWAYYETPEQIDELLCWLNPKGIRELHLKGVLTKYYDMITFGLKKRQQDLAVTLQGGEQRARPSTRHHNTVASEPYLLYQNRWAP